jgi:hypothetical protein
VEQLRLGSGGSGVSPRRGDEGQWEDKQLYSFADLFNSIKVEDFSSYISKVGGVDGGKHSAVSCTDSK